MRARSLSLGLTGQGKRRDGPLRHSRTRRTTGVLSGITDVGDRKVTFRTHGMNERVWRKPLLSRACSQDAPWTSAGLGCHRSLFVHSWAPRIQPPLVTGRTRSPSAPGKGGAHEKAGRGGSRLELYGSRRVSPSPTPGRGVIKIARG